MPRFAPDRASVRLCVCVREIVTVRACLCVCARRAQQPAASETTVRTGSVVCRARPDRRVVVVVVVDPSVTMAMQRVAVVALLALAAPLLVLGRPHEEKKPVCGYDVS